MKDKNLKFEEYPLRVPTEKRTINKLESLIKDLEEANLGDVTLITGSYGGIIGAYASKSELIKKVIEQFYSAELDEGFTIEILNNRGVHAIGRGEEEKSIAQKYDYYSKQLEFMYPKTAMMLKKIRDSYLEEAEDNRNRAEHEY